MKAVVIGGVNIDIGGISKAPLILGDSNPGKVTMSLGGVGRNIAHNLRLLDVPVTFLTAFGEDAFASRIEASCAVLGIDISHARIVPDMHSSTYLFISGPDGDMHCAVSDMDICEKISPDYIAGNLDLLQNADAVVIDANLPEETIRYICAHTDRPIFADPVSTAKAGRLKASLGQIWALKPNRLEAEILSGIPIRDEKSLEKAAKVLLESGLEQVYISLGKDGIFAGVKEENSPDRFFRVPAIPVKVKNATGAGDAFMAGLVKGYLKGLCPEESAVYALKAATITIEGRETINSELSEEKIKSC